MGINYAFKSNMFKKYTLCLTQAITMYTFSKRENIILF